jgi:hypothetical protein
MGRGFYMDFGVLNGSSMVESWGCLRGLLSHMYGFDSFAGLPDLSKDDVKSKALFPSFNKGNFQAMSRNWVQEYILAQTFGLEPSQLSLTEGFFNEVLPKFDLSVLEDKGPCLVANVDCDLYSSSVDVFHFLDEVVTTGTFILLDDYWCYRGSPKHGQRRAFEEWIANSNRIGATAYGPYGGFCQAFIAYEK